MDTSFTQTQRNFLVRGELASLKTSLVMVLCDCLSKVYSRRDRGGETLSNRGQLAAQKPRCQNYCKDRKINGWSGNQKGKVSEDWNQKGPSKWTDSCVSIKAKIFVSYVHKHQKAPTIK
jgi:hypothetical protein